jgi:hypothetical protein
MRGKSRGWTFVICLAALAGLTGSIAMASPRQNTRENTRDEVALSPQTVASYYIDIDFPGGTVEAFRQAVLAQKPNANIVLNPPAGEITLPPIQLRGVELETAFDVIVGSVTDREDGTSQRLFKSKEGYDGTGVPVILLRGSIKSPSSERIGSMQARNEQVRSKPFSLAEIIGEGLLKKDDVLTAIEMSIESYGDDAGKTTLRFHEQTNMLIARGPQEHLDSIEQTLDVLEDSAEVEVRRTMKKRSVADFDGLRVQVSALEIENNDLRMQLANAARLNDELQRTMTARDDALQRVTSLTQELEITRLRLADCEQKLAKP